MKFQFLPENFSRSENAPPFETRKFCHFEVERIFLENKKMLQEFTLRATDDLGVARHSLVRLGDRRGNTTPLAVALHRQPSPEHVREGRLSGLPEMENPASWRKNSAGELTIRRDETDRSIEFRTRFPVGVASH